LRNAELIACSLERFQNIKDEKRKSRARLKRALLLLLVAPQLISTRLTEFDEEPEWRCVRL